MTAIPFALALAAVCALFFVALVLKMSTAQDGCGLSKIKKVTPHKRLKVDKSNLSTKISLKKTSFCDV